MQSISKPASAGDSRSISSVTPSASVRRGRPRIHANDSAKKAAYRQRKFERKLRAHRAAATRSLRKNPPQRNFLSEVKAAYEEGNLELALSLFEQHKSQEEMDAYDQDIEREERRAAKPVKHNRACRGKNACLCGLTMSRGLFLTDAPRACGKLVSGGYDATKVATISDLRLMQISLGGVEIEEEDGTVAIPACGAVEASGWSADRDANTPAKNRDLETAFTFVEKHFQDSSWLKCYVKSCSRLPWGILLEPEDYDGSTYYCCDLHLPTRVE
jgi:hypothetical protein